MKRLFYIFCSLILGFAPALAHAQFQLFPGEASGANDFRIYIQQFYAFSIGAGILIATVLIMIGGIMWTTSAGNPGRIEKAKGYIIDSIIGVVLLIGAYTILQVVNPNLVNLRLPEFPEIDIALGGCMYDTNNPAGATGKKCLETTETQCKSSLKGTFTEASPGARGSICQELCPEKDESGFCRSQAEIVREGIREASEDGLSPSQRDCEAQSNFGRGAVIELSGFGAALDWIPGVDSGETKCKAFCSLVNTTGGTCDMLRADDLGGGRYNCFCKFTPA